ncbi:DUF1501 domain-containing protein [Xanthomonas albilineans]|uniref:Hypothetical secreted protein n=1 Tax=Xanthomonas albilineans (strain GPE PC73 / CFBP 7063) TaxID=380358 RepID=D2UAN6_XANAP|nr:DUF1501 domain-containing protein [Xanthomonas albilineans]QHQ26987.1 putative secreted protein [Xanthomonas albilineans]CBA14793.1 hypothetical secreted protein [Xanthomonas albilineans GPE PC73]
MHRRHFLLASASVAANLPFAGRLFAAPAPSPRLLVVFLRGGYDSNNLLVPYASDFYYASRPSLVIARPDPANLQSAIALDTQWGLNPRLRDTLLPLWNDKHLAFVPFAGTDDLSRSHFETQDSIEAGQPAGRRSDYRTGFLARLSQVATGMPSIAFTDSLPLSFQGGRDIPNLSLKRNPTPAFDQRQADILAGMYHGTPLASAAHDGLVLRQQVSQALRDEMQQANRGAASARTFAEETRRIATLMRERYRLGFVDVGGWDTHVNQGSTDGALADNLTNLSEGLTAYADTLGPEWRNTVVVVLSEFGRTFRENGNKGTDHGHGTTYWVMGGAINGGRIAGEQVAVSKDSLFQDRDYPVLTNYRDLFAGLLGRMWGLSLTQLQTVFPQAHARDLALV